MINHYYSYVIERLLLIISTIIIGHLQYYNQTVLIICIFITSLDDVRIDRIIYFNYTQEIDYIILLLMLLKLVYHLTEYTPALQTHSIHRSKKKL